MEMRHVQPFLDGMDSGRIEGLGDHLSENVVLYSPVVAEPVMGRDAVANVLAVLHQAIDSFTTTAVIAAETRAAVMLTIHAGDIEVTGVDDMIIDNDGRIVSMSIQWRPLANVVALQQKLAPLIGVPALELVEKQTA